MKNERHIGKHPAFDAPYGKTWPCPGEQAVSDEIYYPAALRCAQIEAAEARRQAHEATKLAMRMAKHGIFYQVLAILGWAAVVVMGVWG